MAGNKQLGHAKATKNDEFYTEYSTISNEVGHYRDQFKGKIVYCNCDNRIGAISGSIFTATSLHSV